MRRYDYEIEVESLEPARAQRAINAILADARADPEHPLHRRDHPQHADTLTTLTRLQEMVNPTAPPAEPLEDYQREEIEGRIRELESVKPFTDGTLRRENRAEHEKLVAERSELYARLYPPEGDEGEDDAGGETPDDDGENGEASDADDAW